jgi:hypothetical protein
MTNRKNKSSASGQQTIFDWLQQATAAATPAQSHPQGSLDIDKELKLAMTQDIKHATDDTSRELSRAEVAARMTDLVGDEISLSMINNWTATSHPHGMPAKHLPAFVIATGGQRRAFEVLSRHAGLFALPGPEALRAEIQRIDEDLKKLRCEKQKRELFLREINGGGS